jgi:hypothetical protein
MATFPSDVTILLAGASMQDSSLVERSDMERGVAKVRRTASDPVVTLTGTLMFRTHEIAAGFRSWFYSSAGANAGAGWFDWTDPRTKATRSARFVAGSMGAVTPLVGKFHISSQPCAIEFVDRL